LSVLSAFTGLNAVVTKTQHLSLLASLADSEDLTHDPGAVAGAAARILVVDDDDNNDVYGNENEVEYGLVVDHTPTKPLPFKGYDLIAVQVGQLDTDFKEDAAMSASDLEWRNGGESISDNHSNSQRNKMTHELRMEPNVVDYTPTVVNGKNKRNSLFRSIFWPRWEIPSPLYQTMVREWIRPTSLALLLT
jgi:hypothetical protein